MNRVTGSGAFIAVCRSAWLVAPDPKDAENRRRMFVPIKNNLGDDKTGFAFTIEGARLPGGIGTSRVVFEPFRVFVTADDLLQQSRPGSEDAKSIVDEACDFLRLELADCPQPAKAVEKSAAEAGVTKGTLARARKKLGVKAVKQGGVRGFSLCRLACKKCKASKACKKLTFSGEPRMRVLPKALNTPPPQSCAPCTPCVPCAPFELISLHASEAPNLTQDGQTHSPHKPHSPPRRLTQAGEFESARTCDDGPQSSSSTNMPPALRRLGTNPAVASARLETPRTLPRSHRNKVELPND